MAGIQIFVGDVGLSRNIVNMYIEFAGLPGSGKSTLSSALKRHLITTSCHMLSKNEAIIKYLKKRNDGLVRNMLKRFPARIWLPLLMSQFILSEFVKSSSRHLEFVAFLSKMLADSNFSEQLTESIWNTIVRSFAEIEIVSKYIHDSKIVIMDEAFSQRCFTLFGYMEKSVSNELIYRYASLAPVSNHVVLIITTPETCVERFMQRPQSQQIIDKFKINRKELLSNFKNGTDVLECLGEVLEAQGNFVYRIYGDCDLDESIASVCEIGRFL